MAEAEPLKSIECSFCLLKDEDIQDPRVLPCSHIFCRGCLAGQLEELKIIKCATCSKVFDVVVDNLPTYKPDGPKHKCDVCTKKGKGDQPAVMYCKSCTKKYCDKHQQHHDEAMVDHVTMMIADYVSHADRLETRYCTEHKEQSYSLGCETCLTVFCTSCISPLNLCATGASHKLMSLKELVKQLAEDINSLRAAMMSKEDKLSALFKNASKNISKYEADTSDMITKLHEIRDKQIDSLRNRYEKLEKELIKIREGSQTEMMAFMEQDVGKQLSEISNLRLKVETRLRDNHQVDIVNTFRDSTEAANKLIDRQLPKLTLNAVKALGTRGEKREIEAHLIPAVGIYIGCEPALSATPPKALKLLTSVKFDSFCHSVCHYKGKVYVGTQKSQLHVIDKEFNLKTVTLPKNNWAYGLTVYKDKIYALVSGYSGPCRINIYDLKLKFLEQWNRGDKGHYARPAIVSNQIIIPDSLGKQLNVYFPTGWPVKRITCPKLSGNGSSACAVDENSVIVASYNNSVVFRVDVATGQTIWSSKDVTRPQAVAMRGKDLVCIASDKKLSFLNAYTGKVATEIPANDLLRSSHYVDIDVYDNNLVASSDDGGSSYRVSFYHLIA